MAEGDRYEPPKHLLSCGLVSIGQPGTTHCTCGASERAERHRLEQAKCPGCGITGSLRIEQRLTAEPVGSFSLAGAQTKFSAREVPWLVCGACGIEAEGHR